MADPKCPTCGVVGVENVVATSSRMKSKSGQPWFEIAHCNRCGHVYGVFTKRLTVLQTDAFKEFIGKIAAIVADDEDD